MSEMKNHPLLGQKINLRRTDMEHTILGKPIKYTEYHVDDPAMADKLKGVRVHVPGAVFSCDYVPMRVNVSVDVKTGIIDRVWGG